MYLYLFAGFQGGWTDFWLNHSTIWSSCSHLIVILVTVNIWLLFDLWVYMHVPLTDEYWIIFLTNPLNVSQRFNFSCFIGLSLFSIILF